MDNIKALDAVISRFLPLSDVLYHPLDGIRLIASPDTISWLHDHPMGGDFYVRSISMHVTSAAKDYH